MIDLEKTKYGFEDLRQIMGLLRAPDGCPWDSAQDHSSIRRYFLEEAYEACDAIDRGNARDLCEELGDVLLQVVFHASIAESEGAFTLDDVCDGICRKMIRRHPKLFGGAGSADWEQIKQERFSSYAEGMEHVARALPALTVAEKQTQKAKQAGFVLSDPLDRLGASLAALRRAAAENRGTESALGDLLRQTAEAGQVLDIDPERALQKANDRFCRQFARLEAQAGDKLGTQMPEAQLRLWDEAEEIS